MVPGRFSVLTVVYNNGAQVTEAVESVLGQDYRDVEYIVIDGASTDDTLQRLQPYQNRIAHLISEPDKGIYDAMNKGLALCSGEWVAILNSDDLYATPDVLSRVAFLFQQSGADAVYGDLLYVRPDKEQSVVRYWKSGPFKRSGFSYGWMPPHPSFFLRTDAYQKFGNFRTELRSAADYELMLRMLFKNSLKAVWLPSVLVKMRTGGQSNASLKNRLFANKEDRQAWKMNGLKPWFFTLYLKPLRKVMQYWRRPA